MSTNTLPIDWEQFILKWTLIICGTISVLFVLTGICVCSYRRIRRRSVCIVNCWFCNAQARVLHISRNSWTCPSCKQYNGFTPDGNYNKRITAQSVASLNPPVIPRGLANGEKGSKRRISGNGLCTQCNLNQELKIFQLSSFVPTSEANFDKEIEREKKRLEKLYGLCSSCQRVLKVKLAQAVNNLADDEKVVEKINERRKPQYRLSMTDLDTQSSHKTTVSTNASFYSTSTSVPAADSRASSSMTMDFSENESGDEFDEITSLNNLKIGSSPQKRIGTLPAPISSMEPTGANLHFLKSLPSIAKTSLWKDYPTVATSDNSAHGRAASHLSSSSFTQYRDYNQQYSLAPRYYQSRPSSLYYGNIQNNNNYRSSSVASIFGGKPSVSPVSPTKLTYGFSTTNDLSFNPGAYALYYQRSFGLSQSSDLFGNRFGNANYFNSDPFSRASSQSSGFVSQGFHTPSPLPSLSTPDSQLTSSSSVHDVNSNPELQITANICPSPNNASFGFLPGQNAVVKCSGKMQQVKSGRKPIGRKNEKSRFDPCRMDKVSKSRENHKNRSCSVCYSSDSDDEDNESVQSSCKTFQTAKNRSHLLNERPKSPKKTDNSPSNVNMNCSVTNEVRLKTYFTCKKLFYYALTIGSFMLNLIFISWLIFGNENETVLTLINSINQSLSYHYFFYQEYVKPSEYLQWLSHISGNVTQCVRTNVLF